VAKAVELDPDGDARGHVHQADDRTDAMTPLCGIADQLAVIRQC
jgi:hypothetical protein